MTKEERQLWYEFLRDYPVKIKRQKIISKYIVDFYCAEAQIVIEIDGSQHFEDKGLKKDAERTEFLEQYGLKIIRIPNNEIWENFEGVCDYIDMVIRQKISLKKENKV